MKVKGLTIIFFAMMFMAAPAFGFDKFPEFDAVGDDSANFFNSFIEKSVVNNNLNAGVKINEDSAFETQEMEVPGNCNLTYTWGEEFYTSSITENDDPCFPGYMSNLTAQGNTGEYEWRIILQMKPQTDIDLNIVDCVLRANGPNLNVWGHAGQTGRYTRPNGVKVWQKAKNPKVTVIAHPGPGHSSGFCEPFKMDARRMPTLNTKVLNQQLYTSKALWDESIVMVLPKTGKTNGEGEIMYALHQGDMIEVIVNIDRIATFVHYGSDNVSLKYVGLWGTAILASNYSAP